MRLEEADNDLPYAPERLLLSIAAAITTEPCRVTSCGCGCGGRLCIWVPLLLLLPRVAPAAAGLLAAAAGLAVPLPPYCPPAPPPIPLLAMCRSGWGCTGEPCCCRGCCEAVLRKLIMRTCGTRRRACKYSHLANSKSRIGIVI